MDTNHHFGKSLTEKQLSDEKTELQELLDLIEQELPKTKKQYDPSKRRNKEVERFIRRLGIEPGNNKVPTYLIYHQYCRWCPKNWTHKWGKTEFFRFFSKYFAQKRSGNQRFYMINDALDLSDEAKRKAKFHAKRQKKGTKRKKSKRTKAVSSIGEGSKPQES